MSKHANLRLPLKAAQEYLKDKGGTIELKKGGSHVRGVVRVGDKEVGTLSFSYGSKASDKQFAVQRTMQQLRRMFDGSRREDVPAQ